MQIPIRQTNRSTFPLLTRFVSPVFRHLLDSLHTSLAIAAGLLWLALISF